MLSTVDHLFAELAKIDSARDNTLAKISDEKLRIEAEKPRASEYSKKAWEKRQARRARENDAIRRGCMTHNIPSGPWDRDLDNYQAWEYIVVLEGNYKAILRRNIHWSWNGYVELPEGHCAIGKDYNLFCYECPAGVPSAPMELTYEDGDRFGFDHAHWNDSFPYREYAGMEYSYHAGESKEYLPYDAVLEECRELAQYFRTLQSDHAEAIRKAGSGEEEEDATEAEESAE